MGRKKFSQREINVIGKLLARKMAGTRFQQKMVRHTLRTTFEFNIADFNVQGKAFGPEDLQNCIRRGAIQILDDATIAKWGYDQITSDLEAENEELTRNAETLSRKLEKREADYTKIKRENDIMRDLLGANAPERKVENDQLAIFTEPEHDVADAKENTADEDENEVAVENLENCLDENSFAVCTVKNLSEVASCKNTKERSCAK